MLTLNVDALVLEFVTRFAFSLIFFLGTLAANSFVLRSNTKHGDLSKWDDELKRVYGLFHLGSFNPTRAAPRISICANFSDPPSEDESLKTLLAARRLHTSAARRFENLRQPPGMLLVGGVAISLIVAAIFVAPILQGVQPMAFRDFAWAIGTSFTLGAVLFQWQHVNQFDDLRRLKNE